MEKLRPLLAGIVSEAPAKIVFSAPYNKAAACRKAVVVPLAEGWQLQRYTGTQVFHQNFAPEELETRLETLLLEEFSQLTAACAGAEYQLRRTRKGKLLSTRHGAPPAPPAAATAQHNRQKNYLLPEGVALPALVDMGVFTPEGRVVKAMYGKYRQINRFAEQVDDALKGWEKPEISVVDFGCGKSYLTFILYHYLTTVRGLRANITGLDLKANVVAKCNAAAQKYGYQGLRFAVGDINGYTQTTPVDMVVTLHACDTATDYALASAVQWGARYIFSVPCCQHELNSQMQSEELAILTRYGLLQERMTALMTDAVRANLLTACGYKTQILEFVDLAHTPKNILIRAQKAGQPLAVRAKARQEVEQLMQAFHFSPTLYRLLSPVLAAEES
ncbi:MAG: class I SAM-dependent methyltransferase [Oscillospiraceae bacterium]